MATLGFPLRFNTEKQKKAITTIAKKNNRSLNAELLHMVDMKILASKTQGTVKDPEPTFKRWDDRDSNQIPS